MKYTLGIDLGTSYFKAGLFNSEGMLCGLGRVAVKKRIEDGVQCELAVEDFWLFLQQAIAQAKMQAKAATHDIAMIGYSSQANTFTLLDEKDQPLCPFIVWSDRRSEKIYSEVQTIWQHKNFSQNTGIGIPPSEYFCINKLIWFKQHQPLMWQKMRKIATISDYLVYTLTGQRCIDSGTASLLGILNIHTLAWDKLALSYLGLSENFFAQPKLSGTLAGRIVNRRLTNQLGLPDDIPVYLGSLDHYMAAFGAGLGGTCQATISLGTVVACVNQTPQFAPTPDICVAPAIGGKEFHQLTWDTNGAVVLEWYNRTFCPHLTIAELVQAAVSISSDCDGLVAKPNAHQYENLQGFENIRKTHTHGHFARAIMRSVAETMARLIDRLCLDQKPRRIAATGSGAKSQLWLEICSKAVNAEVFATPCPEPACKGAAMMI